MEFNSNRLIKANEKLINEFNREYEMNAKKLAINGFEQYPNIDGLIPKDETKLKMNNQALAEYKEGFQRQFYEQIVKSIIAVEKKNYTIFELPRLVNQLSELKDIFFDKLNSEEDTYWQMLELFRNEFDDGATYPNPKELTKEYVVNFLRGNKIEVPNAENHSWTKYEKESWFRVALEYAKGEVHRLKKLGMKDEEIAKELFPEIPNKNPHEFGFRYSLGALRTIIGNSYNDDFSKQKHIFGRAEEELLTVVEYCQYHKIEIKDPRFSKYLQNSAIRKLNNI